ncbi:MAG: DUF7208 family protein [Shewanella sp.]
MAKTKLYDGKLSTPTLTAMRIATASLVGAPMEYPQYSTLNEFYKVEEGTMPSDMYEYPKLGYMAIGFSGHTAESIPGPEGQPIFDFSPIAKVATDTGMFSHVPAVLRPIDNDLSDEEIKNYAARRRVRIGQREYWAYYLRRLDMRGVRTNDVETVRENGIETKKEFNYVDSDLNAKPRDLPAYDDDDELVTSKPDGRYVETGADLRVMWTEFDIQEYQNVCAILFGKAGSAIISEIALCSGFDKTATGQSVTGSPFTYEEAIVVQALYHITLFTNLAQTNDQYGLLVRVGQPVAFYLGKQ